MRFLLALLPLLLIQEAAGAEPDIPRLEDIPCDFVAPDGFQARCSLVFLPENHEAPSSRAVILPVVTLSMPTKRQADKATVLHITGGPGDATGVDGVSIAHWFAVIQGQPWLQDRELILFDQRGTELSTPALQCPELVEAYAGDFAEAAATPGKNTLQTAVDACRNAFSRDNIDISRYGTRQTVADIRDIRKLFDIPSWVLFGESYGTRVALAAAGQGEDGIEAMILAGASPGGEAFPDPKDALAPNKYAFERILRRIFAACSEDLSCNAIYPDTEQIYDETINKLKQNPITSIVKRGNEDISVTINEFSYERIIMSFLTKTSEISSVPYYVYLMKDGKDTVYNEAARYLSKMDDSFLALNLIVRCNDSPRPDKGTLEPCRSWGIAGTESALSEPRPSGIPTLFIADEFDPLTPVTQARAVAAKFPNSYLIERPNRSHVRAGAEWGDPDLPDDACFAEIVGAFLDRPYRQPPSSCLGDAKPINFYLAPPDRRLWLHDDRQPSSNKQPQ